MMRDYNSKNDCIEVFYNYDFLIGQLDFYRKRLLKLITSYYEDSNVKKQVIDNLSDDRIDELIELLTKIYMLHNDAIKKN